MDLSHKIIIGLLIILILLTVYKKQENAGNVSGSSNYNTEAIANIASVYSESVNGTASFNNMRITGNINFSQFKGIIVSWSGSIANIPTGWALCDGTKYKALDGTDLQSPDLRSKFICGASKPGTSLDTTAGSTRPNYPGLWLAPRQVGDQGGEENHRLTVAEIPSHAHAGRAESCGGTNCPLNGGGFSWGGGNYAGSRVTDPTGGGAPHNTMPPFYALAYIIKL